MRKRGKFRPWRGSKGRKVGVGFNAPLVLGDAKPADRVQRGWRLARSMARYERLSVFRSLGVRFPASAVEAMREMRRMW